MRVWAKKDIGGKLEPVYNQSINIPVELMSGVVSSLEQPAKYESAQGGLDFGKAAKDD